MTGIPTLTTQPLTGAAAPGIVPMQNALPEQLQRAGQAAQGLGLEVAQAADQFQDQLDESEARRSLRELAEQQRVILRDPNTGFFGLSGANAVESRGRTLAALEKARDDIKAKIGSRQAQALFDRQAQVRHAEAAWDVDGHAGREQREFDKSETSRAIDLYADEAVEWYGRPDPTIPGAAPTIDVTYRQRRQSALDQFDRLAEQAGVPQSSLTYQDMRRRVTGKIAAGVTAKLLAVDPDKAWGFLQEARRKGELDPESERTLSASVAKAAEAQHGQNAARMALEMTGGVAWMAEAQLQDAGLSPGVLAEARRELANRARVQKDATDAVKADTLDRMQVWAIDNPAASWQDWEKAHPKEAAFARQNGQLDDIVEFFGSDKRGADNPATVAALESMSDEALGRMTPQAFLAEHGRNLSPSSRTKWLGKIQGAQPGAPKPIAGPDDLNKLALSQVKGGLAYQGQSMTTTSATRLLALNAEVDRLAPLMPGATPAEKQEAARRKALLDYDPASTATAPKWRWESAPDVRATMPGRLSDGSSMSISAAFGSVSVDEAAAAIAELGSRQDQTQLAATMAQIRQRASEAGNLDPRDIDRVVIETLRDSGLPPGTSPNEVVQAIYDKRKAGLAEREAARAKTPGLVSVDRIARSMGKTPNEVRAMIAERSIEVADDDVAFGDVESYQFGGDRLESADTIVGISRAAADRIVGFAADGTNTPAVLQSTPQAQERIGWLQSLGSPEAEARIAELQAAADRFQAQLDDLEDEEQASPYAENLRSQVAILRQHAKTMKQPSTADVEEAWEAWLQQGGEVYEGEFAEAMRGFQKQPAQLDTAMRELSFQQTVRWHDVNRWSREMGIGDAQRIRAIEQANSKRPRYAAMPTYEQHVAFKKLVDRWRSR